LRLEPNPTQKERIDKMQLEFYMDRGILGVYVRHDFKPTNVGRVPPTKRLDRENHEIHVNDVVCPTVVQFHNSGKYAIKVSDRTFLQFADLDGAANKYGGFIGFLDYATGKCLVHTVNLGDFIDQISMLRSTLMRAAHECLKPSELYIMKRIMSDLHQEAMRLPN